jgi:hypothetical protein
MATALAFLGYSVYDYHESLVLFERGEIGLDLPKGKVSRL